MAEGGKAERFPDEWDIQFLGNVIASQLASGTPINFLIKGMYLKLNLIFIAQSYYWSFQSCFFLNIQLLMIFLSGFFSLTSPNELFWKQSLSLPWNLLIPVAVPPLMVLIPKPLIHTVLTSEGES